MWLREITLNVKQDTLQCSLNEIKKGTENYYLFVLKGNIEKGAKKVLMVESKTMQEYFPFVNNKLMFPSKFNKCEEIKIKVFIKNGNQSYCTNDIVIYQK